jgi:peptidoglycan/LPS O-acetylase OafA/YrhL
VSITETVPPRPRWFAAGDPLRGYACITLVTYHVGYNIAYRAQAHYGSNRIDFGSEFGWTFPWVYRAAEMALQIFFVMSTYLIGRGFVEAYVSGSELPNVRRYLANRAWRVIPAFWVVFAIVIALRGTDGASWSALAKLFFFGYLYDNSALSPVMGQTWSLGIEVAFYVLIPLLALVAIRLPGRSAATVIGFSAVGFVASLWFRGASDPTLYVLHSFPAMAYALMPGLVLAAIGPSVRSVPRWLPATLFTAGLALLALTVAFSPELEDSYFDKRVVSSAVTSIGGTLLLAGPLCAHWSGMRAWRWLDNPVGHWLGARAYSIFLVHQVVIFSLLAAGVDFGYGLKAVGKLWLVSMPLILAGGALVYRFVEQPAMKRMKRWQPRSRLA